MQSTCNRSASSLTRAMSSARHEKSAARIEGATFMTRTSCVYRQRRFRGVHLGERLRDRLERLPLRVDAERDLDDAAQDHDAGTNQVADEQASTVRAVADQPSVERGAERTEDLRDGEEDRDGFGADLDRPGLAHGQVRGARAR